jgi:hypothetical protein
MVRGPRGARKRPFRQWRKSRLLTARNRDSRTGTSPSSENHTLTAMVLRPTLWRLRKRLAIEASRDENRAVGSPSTDRAAARSRQSWTPIVLMF